MSATFLLRLKRSENTPRGKRFSSFRAEGPHVVHYEDGNRGFVDASLSADSLGRLCYMRGQSSTPFSDLLAPEEWRSLRLAIKQSVIGANVSRCLKWLKGRPATVLLCGGAALDAESVRIVSGSVRGMGITVGKANINGTYGPRYGVALGLLLAFQRSDGRMGVPWGPTPADSSAPAVEEDVAR
jgi:hypothetical protein